jgi:hypothetical protein
MRNFIKKELSFLILLMLPFVILLMLYIQFDPFQVVKKYSKYHFTPVDLNRDYISTEVFLVNRQKYKYNSFIFGSSRAVSFNPDSWSKHLNKQAVPFVFDATAESLYGIYTKLKFLEKEKTKIDNVLILFCRNAYFYDKNYEDHLCIKHPYISDESWIKFHLSFFKAYLNLKFLMGYYSYLITHKESPLTHGIVQNRGFSLDYKTNHISLVLWENQLKKDQKKYYESRKDLFYKRMGEKFESVQRIKENHMKMLNSIKEILERHHSNYKIILSPIYDQVKFSPQDKEVFIRIFGEHLYDFTGKNFITENDTNWYETFHFRPFIADSIMNIIYSENSNSVNWK